MRSTSKGRPRAATGIVDGYEACDFGEGNDAQARYRGGDGSYLRLGAAGRLRGAVRAHAHARGR